MIRIKINGIEYQVADDINVLEACRSIGISIPHFCYHQALKVVGSCRMCKVEVTQGGRSRLDISCNLRVAEGMEIQTETPAVQKQRQMTLEYYLGNHPLDCPICDDAGECDLQDFYLAHGRHESRLREPKIRKRKVVDIGPTVVLDSERCVLCSRCVRFCADVTKTHELGIYGMGAREELALLPGATLDNDYSGNVVDLCPVGALTDKDFRFKRRVWYLNMTPSVCQGCSRGCNVRIDYDRNPFHEHKQSIQMKTHRTAATHYQRIQRLKPRFNDAVNGHWICDHGRYGYKPTDAADRLTHALMSEQGLPVETDYARAVKTIATGLSAVQKSSPQRIAVVISPRATSEEQFAVFELFRGQLNLPNIDHRLPIPEEWQGDDLLRTADPYPNRTASEWIGIVPSAGGIGVDALARAIDSGKIDTLISILANPLEYLQEIQLKKLKNRWLILRNLPDDLKRWVDVALPAAAWGEYQGTFVNLRGRIQRLEAAFEPLGESRPVWRLVGDLSTAMKKPRSWHSAGEVLLAMAGKIRFFKGLSWDAISPTGATVNVENLKAAI